jgi:protein-S-isoprenylcysteine O-methyltransferase Ste14
VPGILGFAAVLAGLRLKARIEEQWLEAELGAAYGDYRRRVPMLLPFATAAH